MLGDTYPKRWLSGDGAERGHIPSVPAYEVGCGHGSNQISVPGPLYGQERKRT